MSTSEEYLTREVIEENRELEKACFDAIKKVLANNDKALVANLLDFSRKIILSTKTLKKLLKIALGKDKEIKIDTDIEQKTCICCKKKVNVHVYETILSITVDGEELENAEPALVEYLTEECLISLSRTYKEKVIHIEDTEKEDEDE